MSGIHHVTAISGKAAKNLEFYTRTLGLRLVKKTVNFDDPETYHLEASFLSARSVVFCRQEWDRVRCITSHFALPTTKSRRRWRTSSGGLTALPRHRRSIESISAQCISASQAEFSLRLRPINQALPSMSHWPV